jgi:hypothetical protein
MIAVTRKLSSRVGDTLKLSYDLQSEAAVAEYASRPFKASMSPSFPYWNWHVLLGTHLANVP